MDITILFVADGTFSQEVIAASCKIKHQFDNLFSLCFQVFLCRWYTTYCVGICLHIQGIIELIPISEDVSQHGILEHNGEKQYSTAFLIGSFWPRSASYQLMLLWWLGTECQAVKLLNGLQISVPSSPGLPRVNVKCKMLNKDLFNITNCQNLMTVLYHKDCYEQGLPLQL